MSDKFSDLDLALANYYCKKGVYEKGLDYFKSYISVLNDEALNLYFNYSLAYAKELAQADKWGETIEVYKDMLESPHCPTIVNMNLGLCMKAIGEYRLAIDYLNVYLNSTDDKSIIYEELGEIAYSGLKDLRMAINYYKKALQGGRETFEVYTMLGHLYSTFYRDEKKDKQLYYLEKAYEMRPNDRTAVKNLAFVNGKFGNFKRADELYGKMQLINPLHADLHSYGAYLVRTGRLQEGFKFLRHRFEKEDLDKSMFTKLFYSNKMWQIGQDLKDKKVLVHYEQGFGDTILFVRFVKDLEKATGCTVVGVVVQGALVSLFKDSKLGFPIYNTAEITNLEFDCVIAMMDLPLVLKLTTDKLKSAGRYLKVPKADIKKYREAHIKDTDKFKIGICYEGSRVSAETKRDIKLSHLYPLMQMENVEVYSFQVDDVEKQMDRVPACCKFTRLGGTFKNWKDTACAIENMDLIISTDNGVMNLAGALGKKTFGLFNSIAEWRWFDLTGEDVKWYKSIKPYCCPAHDKWEVPIEKIIEDLKECTTPVLA